MRISWRRCFASTLVLGLVVGCAADRLHHDGIAAVDRGEYETGVALLNQAAQRDPHNMGFRLDLEARRDSAIQQLIAMADSARGAHQLDVAALDYKRVLTLDPNNDRAKRGLAGLDADARHGEIVAQAHKDFERKDFDAAESKLRVVLNEDPGYGPAEDLETAINTARVPITVAPHLKTRDNHKVSLQLRDAPTKMVFEVLSRETGINFILDKDVKSDTKTTIFVQDVPVEQAIDLVLDQNALARQILSDNMVLIYPNIAAKQKEYEQQMVRTFYLTNAAPKDVESMLKTVLAAKTVYLDERTNTVVLRDTPDVVHMAEKLVDSLDVPEPEVMLEVEILEISRSRIQDLGIQYPGAVTFTANPVNGAATTVGSTASGLVLNDLFHQNKNTVGVSSIAVTVNAMKQAGLVNTLATPRIRARNKEKAKILIGSKEPVITNTLTPTAAGTPVVTGSVQYLDVGLTLEVQPTVYLDSDVAIKMSLEVSSILKQVTTTSGTIAYEIGTRNANTLLRLKDGETQILAGLIQDSDTHTSNSIPGLGDIPILSHLFGTSHRDQEKDEIVLSITPRIIRMQTRPASESTEFWYGTESRTRTTPFAVTSGGGDAADLRPAPAAPGAPPAGVIAQPAASGGVFGSTVAAVSGGAPGNTGGAPGNTGAAASNDAAQAALKAASAAAGTLPTNAPPTTVASNAGGASAAGASALSIEGPSTAKVGDEFQVTVHLATDQTITRLRTQLRYDQGALQLLNATAGDMVPAAANSPKVETRGGGAQLDVTTTPDEPVQGRGSLMVLQFKALRPQADTSIAAMVNVLSGSGAAVANSAATPLKVAISAAH